MKRMWAVDREFLIKSSRAGAGARYGGGECKF